MGPIGSCETSVPNHLMPSNNPEDGIIKIIFKNTYLCTRFVQCYKAQCVIKVLILWSSEGNFLRLCIRNICMYIQHMYHRALCTYMHPLWKLLQTLCSWSDHRRAGDWMFLIMRFNVACVTVSCVPTRHYCIHKNTLSLPWNNRKLKTIKRPRNILRYTTTTQQ